MSGAAVAAVDLGAASGRVVVGTIARHDLSVEEVARFPNEPVALPDGLHWDILSIYRGVIGGLREAARTAGDVASVGIDSWAVDYGLLDEDGVLIGDPYHYRDGRHSTGLDEVHRLVSPARLYARNGLQVMPFNTVYQLSARRTSSVFAAARTMLLIPDLIGYWLSGARTAERTNASTTGLLDPVTRSWAWDLIDELGFPRGLFPELRDPGETLAPLAARVANESGLSKRTVVTLVGSHDTASAVVAVPAESSNFAYISCGTWSLVGVEVSEPILTEASRAANFTNEAGVDGRVRFLRNVMGLWLLQETLRTWNQTGTPEDLDALLAAAAGEPDGGPVIDPNDPAFVLPIDMPQTIEDACRRTDQPVPASRPALIRCILDSLAHAYASALADAARLSGSDVQIVHLVGGGARNELLCQLTANACGRPVVAGPVEATAIGNLLVQARSQGLLSGDLESLRALIRASHTLRSFQPEARAASAVP